MLLHVPAMTECNNSAAVGNLHSIETFGSVDGPGVRFVAFLQGCSMRCRYCHNPETWASGGERMTAAELFEKAWKYHNYWGKGMRSGGITVSGGEPLLQLDFVTQVFRLAKEKGVHTALDTSGQPFSLKEPFLSKFNALMKVTDLFLLDLKELDEQKHISLTGHTNKNILEMAEYLSENGKDMWIRHVLVPGLTDDAQGLKQLCAFIKSLKTVSRVEVLPYHTLGVFKWERLGIEYPLSNVRVPTDAEIKKAEALLCVSDYKIK